MAVRGGGGGRCRYNSQLSGLLDDGIAQEDRKPRRKKSVEGAERPGIKWTGGSYVLLRH